MPAAPKANGPVEIIARVEGGGTIRITPADLIGINIGQSDGGSVTVLPGTVLRCLQLGADALAAETVAGKVDELLRDPDCFAPTRKSV